METITIGKHCSIDFMPDVPCVYIKWIGLPDSAEFQKGCDSALDLLKRKGVTKIITDSSEASVFSLSDQKWLNEVWLPRAEKAGYRYSAAVVGNNDAFIKFAVKNISAKRDATKFKSNIFSTIDEAKNWLRSI
jgi:hypothetical protein